MFSTENGISDMFSKIGNVSGADKLAMHFLVRMYGLFC